MAKYYSGITTGTTLDSMLASGSEFGVFPSQDIDCANINVSGIHTVTGILDAGGGIKDSSDSIGTSGKVLSSTGSGLAWIDPSEGSTTNAINVGTNLDSTNADQFVAFMGTSSGNNPVRVDAGVKYNPSTNLLKVGNVELPNLGEFSLGDNQELKMFHKPDTNDVRVEVESNTNYILLTKTFDLKNAGGSIDMKLLSDGLYTAMTTTVAGLVVGIVGYICYNHLVVKISKVVYQMQASSLEFLDLLNEPVG